MSNRLLRIPFFGTILLGTAVLMLPVATAAADGDERDSASRSDKPVDRSSSNYDKTEQFLPGEEVQTPSGRPVKVWSTKGPVPVSRAPEPFEDREKTVLGDTPVIIDADTAPKRKRRRRSNAGVSDYEDRYREGKTEDKSP